MNFQNKVVLVTGSGSGIGQATAILFAKEGADVVIVDCDEENAILTAEKCKEFNTKVLIIKTDITINEEVKNAINKTIYHFGKLDVLVNNAGIAKTENIFSSDLMESYDEVLNTNLRALFYITTLAIPYLIKTKGCIINISSKVSRVMKYARLCPAYAVSKAGVDCFTRLSALELAPSGVRVNAISPGPVCSTNILTNLKLNFAMNEYAAKYTTLGKAADSKEIADLIVYLASDRAKSITGSIYDIDNGLL